MNKQQLSVTVCLKQDITVVLLCRCCRVSQYRFCQIMAENLPRLREDIKEISMSDLKDFLESIRKHSDKVGETAMRQVRGGSPLRKELSRLASTQPLFDCHMHVFRHSSTEPSTVRWPNRPTWITTPSLCTPWTDGHQPTTAWWSTTASETTRTPMKRWVQLGVEV